MDNHKTLINIQVQDKIYLDQPMKITLTAHAQSLSSNGYEHTCISTTILLDFSLTVKATTLIFISGCGSAISYAKEGTSGLIYNLVKS